MEEFPTELLIPLEQATAQELLFHMERVHLTPYSENYGQTHTSTSQSQGQTVSQGISQRKALVSYGTGYSKGVNQSESFSNTIGQSISMVLQNQIHTPRVQVGLIPYLNPLVNLILTHNQFQNH